MTDTSKLRATPETDLEAVRTAYADSMWMKWVEANFARTLERHRDELAEGILTLRYSILADSSLMVLTYDLDKLIALARKCK